MCFKKCFIFVLCLLTYLNANARDTVRVGAFYQPPFVYQSENNEVHGKANELIKKLNHLQNEYQFRLVYTKPSERYKRLEQGFFDLVIYDDVDNGWQQRGMNVQQSINFASDANIFISSNLELKPARLSENLAKKRIAAMFNTEYKFANNNTDPHYLKEHFKIRLFNSQKKLIEFVLKNKDIIGIVRKSYLQLYLKTHKSVQQKLVVGVQPEKLYHYQFIAGPQLELPLTKLNRWLQQADLES